MAELHYTQKEEAERLAKKANHLSDFGTLTSLVSTAAYFIEDTFTKKLPRWVKIGTVGAVGVGIASVVTSYYYRTKAGNMMQNKNALDTIGSVPAAAPTAVSAAVQNEIPNESAEKTAVAKWAREKEASLSPTPLQR